MAAACEFCIGIVVKHDAVRTPQQHDWYGGVDQKSDGCFKTLRPLFDGPERERPVIAADQRSHFAVAATDRIGGKFVVRIKIHYMSVSISMLQE